MINDHQQASNTHSWGLVGVATYDTRRRWAPVRNAGFAWGGSLACLVPAAYAIAQILGGQA